MDSTLRLMIELRPLHPSVPDVLARITLRYGKLTCAGGTLTTAATLSEKEIKELGWYLEEYWQWPYEQFKERAKKIEHNLAVIGKRLYHAVLGTTEAQQLVQPWNVQPNADRQISIVSDIPAVLSLPWELLHDERGFLALQSQHPVSIVRQVSQRSAGTLKTSFEPPLRILLITARPDDADWVDQRSIARELLTAVSEQVQDGMIELEFLRPPTVAQLRRRLHDFKRPPIHILHFDGHGVFGEVNIAKDGFQMPDSGRQGMLAFEDEQGMEDLISAEALARVLQNSGVKLAVFTACQSAVLDTEVSDALSSVATRMIQSGIDGVVAMSASVLVVTATRYVKAFYQELANGTPIPTSQERARQALHDDPRRHLIRRIQDDEGEPVRVRDWWLPHYYEQRPVVFEARKKAKRKKKSRIANGMLLSDTMPQEPRYGFIGRASELLDIERALLQRKLVVISGFGGTGKTALAREAADWFTRTSMYNGACFVSFEHGGDATTLLSAVGNFLDINDGKYNPDDPKVALARIKTAVNKRPILVIVDNLESILPNGEAILESALRTQLWNMLLKLRDMGLGVLLTSRDTSFGDAQLAPGKYVIHFHLGGLNENDAYLLARSLLDALDIKRSHAHYADLLALLAQLDWHPLAIQLVLPQLKDHSIQSIRTDFDVLLLKFKDDTPGRNSSLLASLEYSLNRLSQEQKDLLPRLVIFEGGAIENYLVMITKIPEQVWVSLRPALEQAALLTAEQVHKNVIFPFLHFHPVLIPYLRSQSKEEDIALRERYAELYHAAANYYYLAESRHPKPVRAAVRRELPNLRKALELLLQDGNADEALDMADSLVKFLTRFDLLREREQVRHRVSKVMKSASNNTAFNDLTYTEYLVESGLAEDELERGNILIAQEHLMHLLRRVEATSESISLGRGSYQHCQILTQLAHCLRLKSQLKEAEETVLKALSIVDILLKRDTENRDYINLQGTVLGMLGDVLMLQGEFVNAKEVCEQAYLLFESTEDLVQQYNILALLGVLASKQRNFDEAKTYILKVLDSSRALGEPSVEAVALHNLGMVALEQEQYAEAERCYRESLAIKERLNDKLGAAQIYNQLAIVAKNDGRPEDAEGWYKRAIQRAEQAQVRSIDHAVYLNNLSELLVSEVESGHVAKVRLVEARHYAEQGKLIYEQLGVSEATWHIFGNLARIADLEGKFEEARDYRHRERESFVSFAGNRYSIDQQYGALIAAIVAATKGDAEAKKFTEEVFPTFEKRNLHINPAIRRIWLGDRNWSTLVEHIHGEEALLILRVLEMLQLLESLPVALFEAMQQRDGVAFNHAFETLSEEEQERVAAILHILQEAQLLQWVQEETNTEDE